MNKWDDFSFSPQLKTRKMTSQQKLESSLRPKRPDQDGIHSGFSSSCEGLLRGTERGGLERFWEIPGILHKLIGISNVRQAKPEDGPCAINKAAITEFKIPTWTRNWTESAVTQLSLHWTCLEPGGGRQCTLKTETKSEMWPPRGCSQSQTMGAWKHLTISPEVFNERLRWPGYI